MIAKIERGDHGPGHARTLGQRGHGELTVPAGRAHGVPERRRQRLGHAVHYRGSSGYYLDVAGTTVRDASSRDAPACAAIYAPYVTDTAITFELDPPGSREVAGRIAQAQRTHAWLVLEDSGRVVGYAYGGPHEARPAYRWSCEVSVYLELGRRRTGGGRALYGALLDRLAERGYRTAVAGMTLPNEASVGLHRAMGFEPVGTYRRIGWKHGAWHDVAWVQRGIGTGSDPPAEPQ
jgi:phosphinothricin acetyltransferase